MMRIGYCTNVHAGVGLEQTRANLAEHAVEVKRRFSPEQTMGVGLWLSNATADQLSKGQLVEFRGWLHENGLLPFTLNGFPYGDFHQRVVKHRVYEPTWCDSERVDYTLKLIDILHALLPAGEQGSISTLPLEWGTPRPSDDRLRLAAANLLRVAQHLAELEQNSGRQIALCLEPEPGCVLQTSRDIVNFFEQFLLPQGNEQQVRRYLQVCHDVCHAAVMFEPQVEVLGRYQAAGIRVGKVQVSSAVRAPLGDLGEAERLLAIDQLRSFAEDRYLHQTVIRPQKPSGSQASAGEVFYEDLPLALKAAEQGSFSNADWRIHFHVPVYLERFGLLEATRSDIRDCILAARKTSDVSHFEVETYAWGVLPPELQQPTLAAGIAAELNWFREELALVR